MNNERDFQAGDLVHFNHDGVSVYTIERVVYLCGAPMVELKELPGQFDRGLFKSASSSTAPTGSPGAGKVER